jgi:membrane protein
MPTRYVSHRVSARRRQVALLADLLRYGMRRAREERIAQVAGSLTFTTTLSLVPLMTIGFALMASLPFFSQLEEHFRNLLISNLLPGAVSDAILHYLGQFAFKARGLTFFGLVILTGTAISTLLTIDRALNTIWGVRRARPFSQRVLVYWAVITIGPLLLAISLTITSYLASASMGVVKRPTLAVATLFDLVPFLLLALGYAALYVYVPNRKVAWRDALVGGFAGATAFEIAKRIFAVYLVRFPTYAEIYGALASLPIFLLWLYVSWLITLSGAVLAASLPALYQRGWNRGFVPGGRYGDAVRILRSLYRARHRRIPGLTVAQVAIEARIPTEHADALLEAMESDGLVIRTRPVAATGATRPSQEDLWMFTADPRAIRFERVFRLFAFNGQAVASLGFASDDPLAALVARTSSDSLQMTLEEGLGSVLTD